MSSEVSTSDSGSSPRKAKGDGSKERGFFGRIGLFFRQVIDEMRKVVTPTREELLKMTGVVLVFVIVVIALVFALDWVFSLGASWLFGSGA